MSESVHSQGSEPAGSSQSTPEEQSDDEGIPSDASEYEDAAPDEKKEDLQVQRTEDGTSVRKVLPSDLPTQRVVLVGPSTWSERLGV